MADIGENKDGNQWAKATFVLTMISVLLFVGAVVAFILVGGW